MSMLSRRTSTSSSMGPRSGPLNRASLATMPAELLAERGIASHLNHRDRLALASTSRDMNAKTSPVYVQSPKTGDDFLSTLAHISLLTAEDSQRALEGLGKRLSEVAQDMPIADAGRVCSQMLDTLKMLPNDAALAPFMGRTAASVVRVASTLGHQRLTDIAKQSEPLGKENEQHRQTMLAVKAKIDNEVPVPDSEVEAFFVAKDRMTEISQSLRNLKAERDGYIQTIAPAVSQHRAAIEDSIKTLMEKPGMADYGLSLKMPWAPESSNESGAPVGGASAPEPRV